MADTLQSRHDTILIGILGTMPLVPQSKHQDYDWLLRNVHTIYPGHADLQTLHHSAMRLLVHSGMRGGKK